MRYQSTQRDDLHGYAPDECPVALLLIDVINDLEFDGAEQLEENAGVMAERIAALREQAYAHGVPVIFVNDNFGQWRSDFSALVDHCLSNDVRGRPIAQLLEPREDDYFILKPKHSGFHYTALPILLESLRAEALILTGIAGNICVLFTAHDAYMRQYDLIVPEDCVVSESDELNQFSLAQMRIVLKAETDPSKEIDFAKLIERYTGNPKGRRRKKE